MYIGIQDSLRDKMYIGIQDSLRDKMYIGIPDSLRDREGDNAPGYNPLSDVVANFKICSEQRLDKKHKR